jgi:hypothetical protein
MLRRQRAISVLHPKRSAIWSRLSPTCCSPGRWPGDQEGPAQPVGLVLYVGVPQAAASPVERWAWRVEQQAVGNLVGDVAGLAGNGLAVVVDDGTGGAAEHGHGRERVGVGAGQVDDGIIQAFNGGGGVA